MTEKPKHYYAFYKPRGIITSMSDEQGEGIGKFFPKDLGLFPVGRLDKESEGLLIATNDGDFANEIIHPSNKKEKVYQLRFASKPTRIGKEGIVRNFVFGIRHHGQIYKAQRVKFIADDLLEISVHEGKNHQLRIIAGKIGLEIKSLKRVAIGELKLSKLKLRPGEIKKIKIEDVL
ncbi:MAG: pseudouridine synthase [Candidatus Berkelbacteria bacterium]|nr:pseudouridine synthase [Candidatus Berkelbacteria bacterium]